MKFAEFTASLETDGGKVCVVVFMLLSLLFACAVLVLTGHPPQESGRDALFAAFGSLMTWLGFHVQPKGKG